MPFRGYDVVTVSVYASDERDLQFSSGDGDSREGHRYTEDKFIHGDRFRDKLSMNFSVRNAFYGATMDYPCDLNV